MEDDSAATRHIRQSPRKRNQAVSVEDITLMVRVPGQPAAVRVFTDDEKEDASQYAAQTGGSIIPLPLPTPDGQISDASSNAPNS